MLDRSQIATSFLPAPGSPPVEWRIEPGLIDYERRRRLHGGSAPPRSATAAAPELVWLVEHPPLYTAGTSAQARGPGRARPVPGLTSPGAAANTPITAPASAWPMSCST